MVKFNLVNFIKTTLFEILNDRNKDFFQFLLLIEELLLFLEQISKTRNLDAKLYSSPYKIDLLPEIMENKSKNLKLTRKKISAASRFLRFNNWKIQRRKEHA